MMFAFLLDARVFVGAAFTEAVARPVTACVI
jgi:hypothetical protein